MPTDAIQVVRPPEPRTRTSAESAGGLDVDAAIEPYIADALTALDGRSPLLAGMLRYHLGYLEADFSDASDRTLVQSRGKRLRPAIALLVCEASGGRAATAAPIAAAIELLHNFSLIHDDIQDQSVARRHRPTVWNLWGIEQAINAGDALFAAAHLPILRLRDLGVPASVVIDLVEAFNRMTIEIVEGQVLDLGFEGRFDVSPDAYLDMIAGKTAAIVRFAAWSGAILGGAPRGVAEQFGRFGLALGLGYQIRDDALGIWGVSEVTGKLTADDIRRRKQSLPIVLLRARATSTESELLASLYGRDIIDEEGVTTVLTLLDTHAIAAEMADRVDGYHDDTRAALALALGETGDAATGALEALVEHLALRQF